MPSLDVAINALKVKHGAQQFDEATCKIKRGAKDIDASTKKTDKSLNTMGTSVKKVAVGLIGMAAAYKALGFAVASVKEFAAFEMGLANVSTMLDESTMKYMPGYEKAIKRMAREFGQSTGTLSKGLYDILSASVEAGKAIDVLRVSSKAAIAGLTDTGTAADALTTILNSYGLESEKVAQIGDILFATVKAGKITFGELAGSIGKVSSLAAAVGLDFTEVSAAISTMTRAGVQSDIAMTSLKAMLTAFLKPQGDAIIVAKKFGLVLNAATLETIGLTGVMEKLKNATNEEVAAIFPNVRALTGVAALRGNLTGFIDDQEKALYSLGMQEKAYHKIADQTGTKLKMLTEDWKAMKVASGEFFLKIPGFITETGKLTDALTELSEAREREAALAGEKRVPIPTLGRWGTMPFVPSPVEGWEGGYGIFRQTEEGIIRIDTALRLPGVEFYTKNIWMAKEGIDAYEKAGRAVPIILYEIADACDIYTKRTVDAEKKAKELTDAWKVFDRAAEESSKKFSEAGEMYKEVPLSEVDLSALEELNELVLSSHDYQLFLLDKRVKKFRNAGVDELIIEQIKTATIAALNEKAAEDAIQYIDDQANAYRRLYNDLSQMGKTNFDYKLMLLDKEKKIYATFIKDKALLDEWYAERKRELDNKQAIETNNIVAGFSAGIDQMEYDMKTFGEFGAETAKIMKDGMSDYFMTIGQEGGDFANVMEEVFLNIGRSFQRMLADMVAQQMMQSIMQPLIGIGISAITGGIGGLFAGGAAAGIGGVSGAGVSTGVTWGASAKGNVFSQGTLIPFAKGDILTQPTIFPMSNGGIGLAGEAGDEALMPLGRDNQGRLGVRTRGEQEKQPIKIINIMDNAQIEEYLNSGDGERQIVNIMRRNSNEVEIAG